MANGALVVAAGIGLLLLAAMYSGVKVGVYAVLIAEGFIPAGGKVT